MKINYYQRDLIIVVAFMLLLPVTCFAQDQSGSISELQHDWATANYTLKGDAQKTAFEQLIAKSDQLLGQNSTDARYWIWDGIIKSTYAGVKGGLGALSLAKQSKASLERAISLDGDAMDGSAYNSLGVLYFKVPGWPAGFGSNKKAEKFLKQALDINPNGIDSNYFYADYMIDRKNYKEAENYLLKAQQAAPRSNREVADAGRQQEVKLALELVRAKLTD